VKSEGETTKLGGNHSPSLEIPGHILRVLEGKPWVRERTNLLPRALGMTNFPFSPSSIRPRVHLNIIHLWYSRCLRVKLRQSEDILLREAESMGIVIWCQERDWSRASESSVSLN